MTVTQLKGVTVLTLTNEQFEAIKTVLSDFEEMCASHDKDEAQRRIWKRELKVIRDLRKAESNDNRRDKP